MSFFDDGHVDTLPGAAQPLKRVGLFEGIDIGFDQQYRVDSPFSLAYEMEGEWLKTIKEYERITGESSGFAEIPAVNYARYSNFVQGEEQSFWSRNIFSGEVAPNVQADLEKFAAFNEKIKALDDPRLKSFETILEEAAALQQEVEQRTQTSGGTAGTIGQFIGGVAGSFTGRDPVNLATLGLGGFGKSIAARIATEMGIAGAIGGATDALGVNPNREIVGLEQRSPLQSALFAAVGAGAFRGVGEAIPALARRLGREVSPDVNLDFQDAQLASMFEANPQSPRARAGLAILDDTRELEAASPYGATRPGMARFTAELDGIARVMGGIPEAPASRATRPEIPFEMIERAADFEIVRERAPQVWSRFEEARARIDEIDLRVAELEQVQVTEMSDAIRLVDEEAGERIAAIEARLAEVEVPEPERAALAVEAESIANRIGVERIMRAVDGVEITAKKQRQRLTKQRKTRNKEYRLALQAVEKERDQIKTIERLVTQAQQAQALDLFGGGMTQPSLGTHLRYDVVEANAARITKGAELDDSTAEALVRTNIAEPEGLVDRVVRAFSRSTEDKIDIGFGEPIDADFVFDFDGTPQTAREIMDDLAEDAKLDDAMRSCML